MEPRSQRRGTELAHADGCLTASAGPLARQWYCDVVALYQKHDCVLGPDGFWWIFDPYHEFQWLDTTCMRDFVEPAGETPPVPSSDVYSCGHMLASALPCSFVGHSSLSLRVHIAEKHNVREPFKHVVITNPEPFLLVNF